MLFGMRLKSLTISEPKQENKAEPLPGMTREAVFCCCIGQDRSLFHFIKSVFYSHENSVKIRLIEQGGSKKDGHQTF